MSEKASYDDLLKALKATNGYLLNALIDLESGGTKRTAIATINRGLALVRAAIAAAEPQKDPGK